MSQPYIRLHIHLGGDHPGLVLTQGLERNYSTSLEALPGGFDEYGEHRAGVDLLTGGHLSDVRDLAHSLLEAVDLVQGVMKNHQDLLMKSLKADRQEVHVVLDEDS